MMDKVTERSMRKIGGHYRIAPGAAIKVEHDMTPTEATLDNKQKRNVVKLLRQPEDHPLGKWIRKEIGVLEEAEKWRVGQRKAKKTEKRGSRRGVEMLSKQIQGRWDTVDKAEEMWNPPKEWETQMRANPPIWIEAWSKEEKE